MFKSTITLHSGSLAQIESADTAKLIEVLASNLGVIHSIEVVHQSIPQTQSARTFPVAKKATNVPEGGWSGRDVLLVAQKLIATGAAYGTIQDIVKYVAKHGEQKRKEGAVYIMVNRVKRYVFDGKIRGGGLPKHAIAVLKENGILPGSQSKTKGKSSDKGKRAEPWSKHDIIGIAPVIRQNLGLDKGLTQLVMEYVKKDAEFKSRTDATLYTTTCDLKQYLKSGNASRISDVMKETLDEAGIYPASHGTPVHINRIAPVEA